MKKIYTILTVMLLLIVCKTKAQKNYWDMPTTTTMIGINKSQYSAHKNIATKQTTNLAAATSWNNFTTKVHKMTDSLHARMTRIAALTLDISTMARAAATVALLAEYQAATLKMVASKPTLVVYFTQKEKEIIDQATQLTALTGLFLVAGVMQMNEGARRSCYLNYVQRLDVLRILVEHLYWACKSATSPYGTGVSGTLVNHDKQLADEIFSNAKGILGK